MESKERSSCRLSLTRANVVFAVLLVCVTIACLVINADVNSFKYVISKMANASTFSLWSNSHQKTDVNLGCRHISDERRANTSCYDNVTLSTDFDVDLNMSDYLRRLRDYGLEPTHLHEFKSPYIVDPMIYDGCVNITKAPGKRSTKIISCFNCPGWFIRHRLNLKNRDFKQCPYSECYFDGKGKKKSEADLVMFFPTPSKMPARPLGQIWAYCSWESPSHYGFPSPYSKWKSVFNWTIGYRPNADLFFPNNRLVWKAAETLLSYSDYEKAAKKKNKTAAWFVGNCKTIGKREKYVKEMKKYIDVDIYGSCGSGPCANSVCLKKLNDTYKFYLSFENSICDDYVSEKLFRNLEGRLHIVPVVRGGLDYEKYIPPNTFVNARKFKGAKELALYLKELGNDVAKYTTMLKEKDRLTVLNYKHDWCKTCETLHKGVPHKTIADIKEYSTKNVCHH